MSGAWPFEILGYFDGGNGIGVNFYFLPKTTGYRVAIKRKVLKSSSARMAMMSLVGLEWWEIVYGNRDGIDWITARNNLIEACYAKGVYVPSQEDAKNNP